MMDISICPTFSCNMNCRFCYLRNHDDELLSLLRLARVLRRHKNNIRNLDIYGGEITTLPSVYSAIMMKIVEHFHKGKVQFISNGLSIPDFWLGQFLKHEVGFSIDKSRKNRSVVYENIRSFDRLGKKYSILTIDIDDIDDEFISSLRNVESVSIKPYSRPVGGVDYSSKMLETYKRIHDNNPDLFSKLEKTQPDRDDVSHTFLLPDGRQYGIQYTANHEYFEPIENCIQPVDWKCMSCKYFGRCFNEHYSGYCVPAEGDCLGRRSVMEYLDGLK